MKIMLPVKFLLVVLSVSVVFMGFFGGGCTTKKSRAQIDAEARRESDREREEYISKQNQARRIDYLLQDHHGNEVKLYSELLKNKITVMSFFFTTCKTICDDQGKHLQKLQVSLGERLGTEVNIVSLSKDPTKDTPRELSKWSKRYGVGPGWTLLTGDLPEITKALFAFSGNGPGIYEHQSIMLVGNADKDKWFRISGLTSVEEILLYVEHAR